MGTIPSRTNPKKTVKPGAKGQNRTTQQCSASGLLAGSLRYDSIADPTALSHIGCGYNSTHHASSSTSSSTRRRRSLLCVRCSLNGSDATFRKTLEPETVQRPCRVCFNPAGIAGECASLLCVMRLALGGNRHKNAVDHLPLLAGHRRHAHTAYSLPGINSFSTIHSTNDINYNYTPVCIQR